MGITITTKINGHSVTATADASTSLLEFLRDTLEMKGSKLCCNTGECGACTVIYNGKPINSCVTMVGRRSGQGNENQGRLYRKRHDQSPRLRRELEQHFRQGWRRRRQHEAYDR